MKDPNSEISLWLKNFMDQYGQNFRTFKHGAFHGTLSGIFYAFRSSRSTRSSNAGLEIHLDPYRLLDPHPRAHGRHCLCELLNIHSLFIGKGRKFRPFFMRTGGKLRASTGLGIHILVALKSSFASANSYSCPLHDSYP